MSLVSEAEAGGFYLHTRLTSCQAQAVADGHNPEPVEGKGKGGQLHARPTN